MDYQLIRPNHLTDEPWDAIQSYRRRFEVASTTNDRAAVIGAAKDLIECVARVVLDATETTLGNRADFQDVIKEAQKALGRQPGMDLNQSQDIRAIARGALTIATSIGPIRNRDGSGHGRPRVRDIEDETISVVSDATLLWVCWALRRLGHILARYPELLIAELAGSTNRANLQKHFDAVLLPDQPPEIQHSLGVAFGRSAAGGFGIAADVGLDPAAMGDLNEFPIDFRLGLVDGMVIDRWGQIGLIEPYVARLVDLLAPIPPTRAVPAIRELAAKAEAATWITRWRWSVVEPMKTVEALLREQQRLGQEMQQAVDQLRQAIDPGAA
jgi:hypothetical protein